MDVEAQIAYLDRAAASDVGLRYKALLLTALDLRPGHRVLDAGCGPGTDLAVLSRRVGGAGLVVGLDREPAMVRRARQRTAGLRNVEVWRGDAHHLPLTTATVDRARADRVLQHLVEPARAVAGLRRVLRPGGLAALAEPDWDTLVVDDVDVATSRAFTRFVSGRVVRNATIGRRLGRLLSDAGFAVEAVTATPVVFREYAEAEQVLRMSAVARRGWEAGEVDEQAARAWLERLASGPFLAAFTLFTAVGRAVD